MGYNDKYPRTYHFPFSPGTDNDDKIADDYNELIGTEIVITEKLDGQNTCINKEGVYARSHIAPSAHPWDNYLKPYQSTLKPDLDGIEIFGESMYAVHSIEYAGLDDWFFVFGVRKDGDTWLNWDDVKDYAELIGFPTVPVLWRGTVLEKSQMKNLVLDLMDEKSSIEPDDKRYNKIRADEDADLNAMEGMVVRARDEIKENEFHKKVMKYRRANHVKTDEHWTKNWKRAIKQHERKARLKID